MVQEKYRYKADCKEITGAGLSSKYEKATREMIIRGAMWCDSNPAKVKQLNFTESSKLFGFIMSENEVSKELENYICDGIEPTGAMFHLAMKHIGYINKNGWNKYCDSLIEKKK